MLRNCQTTVMIDSDPCQLGSRHVSVHNLNPDLIAFLSTAPQPGRLLQSMLRVRVIGAGIPGGDELPDICGRHQILENGVRFTPHFPFESGIRYRATFDPRKFVGSELSEVLTLEFSIPREMLTEQTHVKQVFPSCHSLPENLLRFYLHFSGPMQRGRTEEHIRLLDADGRPAPDVLYRSPVELWDRSMKYLTILLDPGRIKRGVGPNRELGPPLKVGHGYTLAIGSGMADMSGRPLRDSFHKPFHVTAAVREPIAVDQWKILPPATKSRQSLALIFPHPLDWALLQHAITIVSERGQQIGGHIAVDQGERRWSFTPKSPWTSGSYSIRIASGLEDVCGNSLLEAFDRPLRPGGDSGSDVAGAEVSFHCQSSRRTGLRNSGLL
jgi:hypothetical protein